MSFDTIDLLTGKVFQVTWDTGRRCNYDCSYCPAHRHDNFSRHATLDELKKNVDFLYEYTDLYMQYRMHKVASFGFTGGEPQSIQILFRLHNISKKHMNKNIKHVGMLVLH